MSIYLGNLSFLDLAEQHSIELTDDELDELESMRDESANIKAGTPKCHIFDMPRTIYCGTREVMNRVLAILQNKRIQGAINVGCNE